MGSGTGRSERIPGGQMPISSRSNNHTQGAQLYPMATLRLATTTRHLLSRTHGQTHVKRNLFTKTTTPARSPLRTGLYATIFTLSTGLFAVYYFDARSSLHRYFITPILRYGLDAETGHKVAVKVLRSGLGPRDPLTDDERLRSQVKRIINGVYFMLNAVFADMGTEFIQSCGAGGRF
jgi:hypothetical protein